MEQESLLKFKEGSNYVQLFALALSTQPAVSRAFHLELRDWAKELLFRIAVHSSWAVPDLTVALKPTAPGSEGGL